MADKPILIFPAATAAARQSAGGGPQGAPPRPSKHAQGQRLSARFQALNQTFGAPQADLAGVDPEQVIVLETIGSLADFQSVVKRIDGLEWLGDFDAEVAAADVGFLADGADPSTLRARLFVLASNRTAYNEVLGLWQAWQQAQDDKLPRNFGRLADAFKYLNDVRAWGSPDRILATGVKAYWEAGLAANTPTIRFEAELWCRTDPVKRQAAFERLRLTVHSAGGQCITQAALPEIDYHGVLVELPASAVQQTVNALNAGDDTQLLRLTEVRYFMPLGQAAISPIEGGQVIEPPERQLPTGDSVVAILDGYPLANHAALAGRLVIDDPDGYAATYQAGEQRHGTAMASLVVHGEYDGPGPALESRVYVRPVMVPGTADLSGRRWETFPSGELAVDLVHRAVRRMFDGEGNVPPQAPSVRVINLSLGDRSQPFDGKLSPWARLLDWLAWKYQVLFVVSAGNHLDDIVVPAPPSAIAAMSDADLRSHTLRCMAQQRVQRRLLAPAESLNALTVGALHSQGPATGATGVYVDLLRGAPLCSPVSSVASGFRRAVKPEILAPGGLRHYAPKLAAGSPTSAEFNLTNAASQPGQLVAACHPTEISNRYATRACGSSNSAALTTHQAARLAERLKELQAEPGGAELTGARFPVILKALLVHGSSWGAASEIFNQVFDGPDAGLERWWRIKRACAQFLGYGPADFERGTVCTDQRVIVLGSGALKGEEGHVYHVPLPTALNAQTVMRRLTVTLAWLSPINPRHRNYRVADLWFEPPSEYLRVKRRDADHDAVTRGTVQHEVLEGSDAVPITADSTMPIQVNCRPEAASKIDSPVPYALVVSLETAQPLAVSIYDQIKAKLDALRTPVAIQP